MKLYENEFIVGSFCCDDVNGSFVMKNTLFFIVYYVCCGNWYDYWVLGFSMSIFGHSFA